VATPPSVADVSPEPVAPRPAAPAPARGDDAINLGSTVLPILAKTYWKQGLGLLLLVVVVVVVVIAL
jgi:hypothetical protein